MNHRYARLRNQHRHLEEMLRAERARVRPDPLRIQDLKRRKLMLKDELFLAQNGLAPVTAGLRHL